MQRAKQRGIEVAAAGLAVVVAAGCAAGSPLAESDEPTTSPTGTTAARRATSSTDEPEVALAAKRVGAPTEPAHVWVGWAHTDQGLQQLWASFRLDGGPPSVDGQAVILAATGESSSCPSRLTDAVMDGDTLRLSIVDEPAIASPPDDYSCTADFNPVTFVLRADRELVERVGVVDFGDTTVPLEAAGRVTREDYGG